MKQNDGKQIGSGIDFFLTEMSEEIVVYCKYSNVNALYIVTSFKN